MLRIVTVVSLRQFRSIYVCACSRSEFGGLYFSIQALICLTILKTTTPLFIPTLAQDFEHFTTEHQSLSQFKNVN